MARIANRIIETSTSEGTGDLLLNGSVVNYRSFNEEFNNAEEFYYTIVASNGWEIGIGRFNKIPNTISRLSVLKSSNSNSKVVFDSSVKNIFVSAPSEFHDDFKVKILEEAADEAVSLSIAL